MVYSTPEAVRQSSGIKPGDLSFESDVALDAWLSDRLAEVTDFINVYTGRDFEDTDEYPEGPPPGVVGIAREMGRNLVAVAVAARQSPVVRIDDWSVQIAEPEVFSAKHRRALDLYRKGRRLWLFRVGAPGDE